MDEVTGKPIAAPSGGSQPPFRQLEVFHAIMETGSMSAASRMLGTTQPSLSRSLQRLEDQLRVQLFRRHRKRLVATNEAKRLYDVVAPAVHQVRAVSDVAAGIADGPASIFRFAATQSVGRTLVPRAVRAMRKKEPGLRMFLDSALRAQHSEYLLEAQGECLVSLAEVKHPLISSRVIGRMPLVALVRSDGELASRPVLTANDLTGHPVILFERRGPHSAAIEAFFADCPRSPEETYIRFSDAAIGLAAEGVGTALVDGFTTIGWLPPGLVEVAVADAPSFTARLYWNSERPGSRFVELLGDTLVALMADVARD